MRLNSGQKFALVDAQQRALGEVEVERNEGDLVLAKFVPGPAFATVEHHFRAFEDAADCQALSVVAGLAGAIAALGLRLQPPDGSQGVPVHDVQLWRDGGASFRLSVPAATVNGSTGSAHASERLRQ